MTTDFIELYIVAGIYLSVLIAAAGALKLIIKKISFAVTLAHAFVGAVSANVVGIVLRATLIAPGYFWGEIPLSILILHWFIMVLPGLVIIFTLWWSVNWQSRLRKQAAEA